MVRIRKRNAALVGPVTFSETAVGRLSIQICICLSINRRDCCHIEPALNDTWHMYQEKWKTKGQGRFQPNSVIFEVLFYKGSYEGIAHFNGEPSCFYQEIGTHNNSWLWGVSDDETNATGCYKQARDWSPFFFSYTTLTLGHFN
jgi:hypothetical protein